MYSKIPPVVHSQRLFWNVSRIFCWDSPGVPSVEIPLGVSLSVPPCVPSMFTPGILMRFHQKVFWYPFRYFSRDFFQSSNTENPCGIFRRFFRDSSSSSCQNSRIHSRIHSEIASRTPYGIFPDIYSVLRFMQKFRLGFLRELLLELFRELLLGIFHYFIPSAGNCFRGSSINYFWNSSWNCFRHSFRSSFWYTCSTVEWLSPEINSLLRN